MRLHLWLLILAVCWPSWSLAAVIEEVIEVPVSLKTIFGQDVHQRIKVTVFRESTREKAPYLVLNHGRPANAAGFANMGRQRYVDNSRYLVSLGFVVLVPTRVGYGETGGPAVEYSGPCERRDYAHVYAAAADQTVEVLRAAASLPYVDLSRGIVLGQSFGGLTSIALSARELPGLAAAVNFAGGGGGNPVDRPANPCSPARLTALFEAYGAVSKVPSLWLYSENDRFWGATLPKKWFDAFVQAGGQAEFVPLPPYRDDGHGIFNGNRSAWKSAFEGFLTQIGFQIPVNAPPSHASATGR